MPWYSSKLINEASGSFLSQVCLSSFKYLHSPESIEDMLFTGCYTKEILLSKQPHHQQVTELLESAKLCVPYLGDYINNLVTFDDVVPDLFTLQPDKPHCRIVPKDKPLYLMTAKEMHWSVALVRSGLEFRFAYSKLCELDNLYKTQLPKFLLWILAHRYRLKNSNDVKCFGQTTDFAHTMFSEFNMNVNLERIVGSFKDVLKRDDFPVITSGFHYWSRIEYPRNVVDRKDQNDFKDVGVIYLEGDNEFVWFTNIMKQVALLNKYIGE